MAYPSARKLLQSFAYNLENSSLDKMELQAELDCTAQVSADDVLRWVGTEPLRWLQLSKLLRRSFSAEKSSQQSRQNAEEQMQRCMLTALAVHLVGMLTRGLSHMVQAEVNTRFMRQPWGIVSQR